METTRFDAIAKAFGSSATRRRALAALFGGTFGSLGFADAEAAKSGACRPACTVCQMCIKGKC
jgi:hypothetical protein